MSTAEEFDTLIRENDSTTVIRYSDTHRSTLGGENQASLLFRGSLQGKTEWINGILHNSQYAMFSLHSDNKLTLFSSGMNMPKFRKCKVKSLQHAAEKIVAYFLSV